jgi:hypothetical protein
VGLIPANTLARLRAYHAARLPDTAEVLDYASSARGLEGGTQRSGVAVEATYPCRVSAQQLEPAELTEGGRPVAVQFYDILLPWNAVVQPAQRIRISSRIYQVVNAAPGESEAVVLNVVAIEVT